MLEKSKIAVVIPFYNAAKHIQNVVEELPSFIDAIYIVDDRSPEPLPEILKANKKVEVITNDRNLGVGGATKVGFTRAIADNIDFLVKVDADGQMDSNYIQFLIEPLYNKKAEYAKGNRFRDFKALHNMPFTRKAGNLLLSFFVKAATGYWNNFDPTNGFFAINVNTLKHLDFKNISNRYYFETSLIAELYFHDVKIQDISMPAIYGEEESNMKVWKMPFVFIPRLFKTLVKRIVKSYFVYDFNMCSVYLLLGIPLFLFGFIYGLYTWWFYSSQSIFAPTGTIMLVTLTIILGFQLLLQAIQFDITNAPKPLK